MTMNLEALTYFLIKSDNNQGEKSYNYDLLRK